MTSICLYQQRTVPEQPAYSRLLICRVTADIRLHVIGIRMDSDFVLYRDLHNVSSV